MDATAHQDLQKIEVTSDNSGPTVAVVICTRNRPASLRNCLHAISQMRRAPNQTIVVDNTPGEKETELLAREYGACYIVEPTPGLSRARNRGLAETNCDVVAYLDDDAMPEEGWLDALRKPFVDPAVCVVTGGIVPVATSVRDSSVSSRSLTNKDPRWFEIAAYGGLGIGTNMALRREQCLGWEVFDERLGRGAPLEALEEHHAFVSLVARGHKAVFLPDAVVIHTSHYPTNATRDARNSIAYWMILFSEYPEYRRDLLGFLFRRLRHKPREWHRNTPDPGDIITSNWGSLLKAGLAGALLYLRCRKVKK